LRVKTEIILGDCSEKLKELDSNLVDLIITSPPYANQRKGTYGGILNDEYVDWFLPISKELLRVLKPTGTFILNIKENVVSGERHTYVLELIMAMREQGWLWTEEFMWHKKNAFPGKWPNRFRDAWERLLQFNKEKKFNMYQDEVMVPTSWSTKDRMTRLCANDKIRKKSGTSSGMDTKKENWVGREKAYPTNVLHLPTECGNRGHSAVFPEILPEWFIRLFTTKGADSIVLDPFAGSGTTLFVAQGMGRSSIGIEKVPEYYDEIKEKLDSVVDIFAEEQGNC
jgi:site-specific DNA-methyltransferase (adenine-specific)